MAGATLLQAGLMAANNGENHKAAVIETFVRETDLMRVLPFMDIGTAATYSWNVENTTSQAAARAIGGTYTASSGIIQRDHEDLKIVGGEISTDQAIVKMYGPAKRAWDVSSKVKQIARQVGYYLIEGDTGGADPLAFDGIKTRVPTSGSQALALASAAALSMKKLDELIYMVDNPTHIVMNKKTELNIRAFLRSGGSGAAAIQMSADEFGRPMMTYAGLPILIADRTGTLSTLGFTEGSSTSSLFVCSIGMDGYHGIQSGGIEVEDLGKSPTAPVYISRMEWLCSQLIEHPRAIARGYNFTDATAVA